MSQLRTRREVLTMAGAGIAAMAGPAGAEVRRQGAPAPPEGDVQVRRTYAEKRYAQDAPLRWQDAGAADESAMRLDRGRTFQEALGFGASLTDAA